METCIGVPWEHERCDHSAVAHVGVMNHALCETHLRRREQRMRVLDAQSVMCGLFGKVGEKEITHLCREWTGFSTLPEMFADASYRPSMYVEPRPAANILSAGRHAIEAMAMRRLADAYDAVAAEIGDKRRAYRGT